VVTNEPEPDAPVATGTVSGATNRDAFGIPGTVQCNTFPHVINAVVNTGAGHDPMIARPGKLFAYAVLALISTIPLWVMGALGSGMLTLTSATTFCNEGGYENFRGLQEKLFPLDYTCLYADGHTEQLVSPLVNPLIFLLLGSSLLLAAFGIRTMVAQRRERSAHRIEGPRA
jgi:hypothetical protein